MSREVDDRHTRSERLSWGREGFVQLSPNVMLSFPVLMWTTVIEGVSIIPPPCPFTHQTSRVYGTQSGVFSASTSSRRWNRQSSTTIFFSDSLLLPGPCQSSNVSLTHLSFCWPRFHPVCGDGYLYLFVFFLFLLPTTRFLSSYSFCINTNLFSIFNTNF